MVSWDTPKLTLSTTLLDALPNAFTMLSTRSASPESATTAASSWTSLPATLPGAADWVPPATADGGAFFHPCVILRGSSDPESTHTRIAKSTKP